MELINIMVQLSNETLNKINQSSQIALPQYKQSSISVGVVHFGTGNFHRAHQAVYCDSL